MKSLFSLVVLTFLLLTTQITEVFAQSLTIYSGRSKALVDPIVNDFQRQTGIRVNVRYGGSTQLAVALLEEGRRSPADLFWAQDAGALGAVTQGEMLQELPESILELVPEQFRSENKTWVATSGRARVLAYSTVRSSEDEIPSNINGLTDPKFRNRVGWAPSNASFQAFLTGFRLLHGDDATRDWLRAMRENDAQNYVNNNALIQAIAAGEIDFALTNHYYLFRYTESNPNYPVAQTFFENGDPGNLNNVSGAGILKTSRNAEAAQQFISFMLEQHAQRFFTENIFEYPATEVEGELPGGVTFQEMLEISPQVDLDALADLEQTIRLLREVGLL